MVRDSHQLTHTPMAVVLIRATADYYFIQAGNKLLEMGRAGCNE